MTEASVKVVFLSINKNLVFLIKPGRLVVVPGETTASRTKPKMVRFVGGRLVTSDPEVISTIEASESFRRGLIIRAKDGEPIPHDGPRAHRGAISAATIQGTAPAKMPDNTSRCEVCGKEFPADTNGRKLRMHSVAHRMAEAKAKQEDLTPAGTQGLSLQEK